MSIMREWKRERERGSKGARVADERGKAPIYWLSLLIAERPGD